ncbi:MAG: TetR/AcrR family transcriptional regulator, partial [Bacteroidales bacterium]|nr:TetR/AcrR family transcriptional regulator [Bacteroidales bacterium]
MPLQTFLNLSKERRQKILDAAYEEFALNSYSTASLSKIISKLGLAKGSFYRYFSSKKELYLFLLKNATEMRLDNAMGMLESEDKSLYEKLVENFIMKVKFDLRHPVISGFLYNVLLEKENEETGNVEIMIRNEIDILIKRLLEIHIKKGEIRNDVDIDVLSFTIMQVQTGIYDFIEKKFNLDFRKNIREKKPVFSLP